MLGVGIPTARSGYIRGLITGYVNVVLASFCFIGMIIVVIRHFQKKNSITLAHFIAGFYLGIYLFLLIFFILNFSTKRTFFCNPSLEPKGDQFEKKICFIVWIWISNHLDEHCLFCAIYY